jgi:plasmid stabilization system protein ParE
VNKLKISKRAIKEIENSYVWYEESEQGLGERFRIILNEKFKQLLLFPKIGGVKKSPYREVTIDIFPFSIIYKYRIEKNIVFITSVFHFKRSTLKKYNS